MYSYEKPDNLVASIESTVARYPNNPLFGVKNRSGEYEWTSYKEVGKRIDNLRAGLAGIGVGKGDAVGIISKNRPEWAIAAFAAYGLGARFVPMYEKELASIWKYIINDSGVKVLLTASADIYNTIKGFQSELPGLQHVFYIEGEGKNTLSDLEQQGQPRPVPSIHPAPSDIAALIYTSGTTGNPKGVLLTHGNFTSNVLAASKLFPQLGPQTRVLSILPWAHSFGQTGDLNLMTYLGGAIGFVQDTTTIGEDIARVRPTFLIAVPRVFNKIYDGLWAKMNEKGGLAKKLFLMGIESAKKKRGDEHKRGKTDILTLLKLRAADAVVFKKIRERFGGVLECAVSGSATMNVEISLFFSYIGIPVYDCYGLSETSPAATANSPKAHKPGTVGRAIPGVRVAIDTTFGDEGAGDGEIIIYGPNVMKGYHNNPDATRAVMTGDGGFRTGDRGRLDEDGFLYITGRIKEQYKLENGKYVFPATLEEEIKLSPWAANAMIYGEGMPYNICLLVPDAAVLEKYAKENHLSGEPAELIRRKEVQEMIIQAIREFLKGKFRDYEIPRKYLWLAEDFSLDNEMLTQTMKLKRRVVLEKYKDQIMALYKNDSGLHGA